MNMYQELLDFFTKIPYSIPQIIGFFLIVQAVVFYEVFKRSKDNYSHFLSFGLLLLGIAWGTTDYQNTGKLYVDWKWWWAQPFFAFGILFMMVGVVRYLPLEDVSRKRLNSLTIFFPVVYVALGTTALLLEYQMQRAYIIWMQLPPFIAISLATFKVEKKEPGKGHRLIGLLALFVPLLSVIYPLLSLKTTVLRFWTAVPLLMLASIVLAASLLRERERIQQALDDLKESDDKLLLLNKDLEIKVNERTAMLHDMITDLESFNRSVSHDIRSPLGTIAITASIAEKYLAKGSYELVSEELRSIRTQVDGLHSLVGTMLNLAANVEKNPEIVEFDFKEFIDDRVDKLLMTYERKLPNFNVPQIHIDDFGVIRSNKQLLNIIVDNLLDNSIKYNLHKSDFHIRVGCESISDGFKIYVSDNGVGINADAEHVDLYMPFKRVDVNDVISPGFGLGLNIVKRAVKKLGGSVWYEPTSGGGVTFFFNLHAS